MPDLRERALVSPEYLKSRFDAPDLRIVDATWFLPGEDRDARAEYQAAHIPKAVFFDIDEISDDTSDLPHMVPPESKFSSRVRKMGLGDGTRICIYDNNNFFASARAWWLFRLMGHQDVGVLDGGLQAWKNAGGEVTDDESLPSARHFTVRKDNFLLRELDQMRNNLTTKRDQVVDARSSGRFKGEEPEPREGLRAGNIPGSVNLHYRQLIGEDGRMKGEDELRRIFANAGIDTKKPIVTTCGSGVSAAVINLALFTLGRTATAMYDGSWTEWGSQPDTPVG